MLSDATNFSFEICIRLILLVWHSLTLNGDVFKVTSKNMLLTFDSFFGDVLYCDIKKRVFNFWLVTISLKGRYRHPPCCWSKETYFKTCSNRLYGQYKFTLKYVFSPGTAEILARVGNFSAIPHEIFCISVCNISVCWGQESYNLIIIFKNRFFPTPLLFQPCLITDLRVSIFRTIQELTLNQSQAWFCLLLSWNLSINIGDIHNLYNFSTSGLRHFQARSTKEELNEFLPPWSIITITVRKKTKE